MSHENKSASGPAAGSDPRSVYWRSFEQLQSTPRFGEFLAREFPQAASEFPEGISRRRWMQLMGASLALAGVAGCRWQAEEFLPAAGRVPDYVPGEPQFFATSWDLRGAANALLVTLFDGRPIKVEGNPQHPASHGASDAFSQALVLDLYDPDRIGRPRELVDGKRVERAWEQAEQAIRRAAGTGRLRILAGSSSSPSRDRLERALLDRLSEARWVEYEPLGRQEAGLGAEQAFGRRLRPQYRFTEADVVLALDADPFGTHPNHITYARDWASRRTPETGSMNRVYAVESQFSQTGSAADHRLPLRSTEIPRFLADLEQAIDGGEAAGGDTPAGRFLKAVASDLAASRGRSLIVVGDRQPAAVHARAHRLNARLGNVGATVVLTEEPSPARGPYGEAVKALADEMRAGEVETLVILRGNPAYDAPADADFAAALAKVPNAIHLGDAENETSRLCRWFLPASHPFEEWGDGRAYDGTYTFRQPLIDPLHGGRSELELLAMLLGDGPRRGEQIVRATFDEVAGGGETAWRRALHDGFVADSATEPVTAEPTGGEGDDEPAAPGDGLELVFIESEQVYDGRFANNAWLQETPGVLSKITWDNAAFVSVADAEKLGVANQDVVRLTYRGKSVELPVYVMAGQAAGSIGVALGYGRTAAGHVGGLVGEGVDDETAPVGADVNPLRFSDAMDVAVGVTVEKTGRVHPLATTQDHFAIDEVGAKEISGRVPLLVREGTQEIFKHDPDFAKHAVHHPELESLWNSPEYAEGYAWGMAIDLSKCTGCNACVVACQSENNVPVVGKEQVLRGREMHWLRIDRYFRGAPADPVIVSQPVLCMHCEHAPCEQVCPVAAAVHDTEGLNLMVYNRCVGTRYCNNNCPYKVRRFNFLNWEKQPVNQKYRGANQALAGMVHNPEVTVRSRGVMEKCTYCLQRISNAKIHARNEGRKVRDGELQTACGQACPTGAIVFGDLLDRESRVSKLHYMTRGDDRETHPRAYAMLGELNTRPRTAYLARIRNPHPTIEEDYAIPPVHHADHNAGHTGGHAKDAEHRHDGQGHEVRPGQKDHGGNEDHGDERRG